MLPRLWIGSHPGNANPVAGLDVIVLCARERQHEPWIDGQTRVLRAPLSPDLPRDDWSTMFSAAERVAAELGAGKRVLVCCSEGTIRGPLVAVLAAIKTGLSAESAIGHARACRDVLTGTLGDRACAIARSYERGVTRSRFGAQQ